MPESRNEETKKCPRCGAEFLCSSSSRCWCYEYDIPVEQLETLEREYNSCLCPECLKLYSRTS